MSCAAANSALLQHLDFFAINGGISTQTTANGALNLYSNADTRIGIRSSDIAQTPSWSSATLLAETLETTNNYAFLVLPNECGTIANGDRVPPYGGQLQQLSSSAVDAFVPLGSPDNILPAGSYHVCVALSCDSFPSDPTDFVDVTLVTGFHASVSPTAPLPPPPSPKPPPVSLPSPPSPPPTPSLPPPLPPPIPMKMRSALDRCAIGPSSPPPADLGNGEGASTPPPSGECFTFGHVILVVGVVLGTALLCVVLCVLKCYLDRHHCGPAALKSSFTAVMAVTSNTSTEQLSSTYSEPTGVSRAVNRFRETSTGRIGACAACLLIPGALIAGVSVLFWFILADAGLLGDEAPSPPVMPPPMA